MDDLLPSQPPIHPAGLACVRCYKLFANVPALLTSQVDMPLFSFITNVCEGCLPTLFFFVLVQHAVYKHVCHAGISGGDALLQL